jgi:SAM-dependent methyltransferase
MRFFGWFRRPQQEAEAAPPRRWAWLGGRRVLTTTPYILPKDKMEGDRLDLQHYLLKVAVGRNYYAPVRQPRSILDVATGTGIWGRELAQEFRHAEVIGIDIDRAPLERALERLGPGGQFPSNFHFQEANVLQGLPFEAGRFDFVHSRLMAAFVPWHQWPGVVAEMVRVTKNGGYVEIVESEGQVTPSPGFNVLYEGVKQLVEKRGIWQRGDDSMPDIAGYLSQAGIPRVQTRRIILGVDRQGRPDPRQQRLLIADVLAAYSGMEALFVRLGILSAASFQEALAAAREELPRVGLTMPMLFAFGLKR